MQDGQDRDAETARVRMLAQHRSYQRLLDFDRPVIAAVDGVAFGAGFSYAIAADIVIASDRARFCLSLAKVGLVPDLGLMHTLPRLIGLARVRDLIYTAPEIGAKEAHDLGLVHEVTSAVSVASRAQQIARAMTHVSPSAFAMTKSIPGRTFELEMNALLDGEASAQGIAFGSDYVKESIERFMRREPSRFSWPATPKPYE